MKKFSLDDHACADGFVGAGVDEDEAASLAVAAVAVENQGHGGAQGDAADVVHGEGIDALDFVEGVDIDLVFHFLDDGFRFLGGVADDELRAGGHGLVRKPADHGFDVL